MNKLVLFILIVFASQSTDSQAQNPPESCQAFVAVYMGQKGSHETSPEKLRAFLEKHGIDQEAYASLFRSDSTAAKLRIEQKFQNLYRDIQKENERLEQK